MLIDQNITYLTRNERNWIAFTQNEEISPDFKMYDEKGDFSLFEFPDNHIVKVEDTIDSSYQSRKLHKEILFVFGIFALKEIEILYETKHDESLIIVIEPRLGFLNTALNMKNMKVFSRENIILFADPTPENIISFLHPIIHSMKYARLLKKINFYFTDYYRKNDTEIVKKMITIIRQTVLSTMHSFGNDIPDSLIGLEHNLKNISYILKSKNIIQLYNAYKDQPAIIVAAGPSLNKNLKYLKLAQGKALIIAVDTIIKRLLEEGIVPDFVCSIERVPEVYEYFYQNQQIPEEVTLVGPAVLDSRVFEEFKGNIIIPFRNEVSETDWMRRIMQLPAVAGVSMGSSCAHVAFGIAEHLGCSPIILIGQDLAYGASEKETHASGTFYDTKKSAPSVETEYTEGYYDNKVQTTRVWIQFKTWFENRIAAGDLKVIDATEGGARIYHTERETFKQTIAKYCTTPVAPMYDTLKKVDTYPINKMSLLNNLKKETKYYHDFLENIIKYFKFIDKMEVTDKNVEECYDYLDIFLSIVQDATSNALIMHNLQPVTLKYLWEYNGREQIINYENVQAEKNEQIKLLGVMARTIYEIKALVEEAQQQLEKELEK